MQNKLTIDSLTLAFSNQIQLQADLTMPINPQGIIIFAHGSGSSRLSPRNQYVAEVLNQSEFATLLVDLLTPTEERIDRFTHELRFNISLLAKRLELVADWIAQHPTLKTLKLGYFGASTGAAAALIAAANQPDLISAIVSRGGRPDLAGDYLKRVQAPTLLIVGGNDSMVMDLNKQALNELSAIKKLEVIASASHLFEEPGTLEQVAMLAVAWYKRFMGGS